MPYYWFDDFEEDNELDEGPREFHYEPESGRFDPAQLGEAARLVYAELRAMDATGVRVKYDGGSDEGFGYLDAIVFGNTERPVGDMTSELLDQGLLKKGPAADQYSDDYWADHSDSQKLRWVLDELADELATRLLGEGFGTGELELYGEFTADFATGALIDNPDAVKPD